MKHILLILGLVLIVSCSQKPQDCANFKTGTFKYINPEFSNLTVVRNDSVQVETDSNSGLKITSSVKWISDCKYSLTFLTVNKSNYNSIIGVSLSVDIISTKNNTYEYYAHNDSRKNNGKMIKMEE